MQKNGFLRKLGLISKCVTSYMEANNYNAHIVNKNSKFLPILFWSCRKTAL